MISYSYIFLLTFFYDNLSLKLDYYIIISLINIILIISLFYKKLNFKLITIIIVSSVIIDFLTYNYMFSVFLISFFPIIILNKLIKNYYTSKFFIAFTSMFLSYLLLIVFNFNFYIHLNIFDILIMSTLIFISNMILLRYDVLRF